MFQLTLLFGLLASLLTPAVVEPTVDTTEHVAEEREHQCLALNVYWEARSEPRKGRQAVAAVTLNRVAHPAFPDSVCDVITQGGERRNRCQFSWWCDGKSDNPKDMAAWADAQEIARNALADGIEDPTAGALFYHATYVKPRWARRMARTTKIGRHIFFADPRMTRLESPLEKKAEVAPRTGKAAASLL